MHHQPTIVRWSMPICIVVLIVLSLIPSAWLGWSSWFGAQARVVVSPAAAPITWAKNIVIPQSVGNPNASLREQTLQSERDRYRTLLYREQQANKQLSALVDQLSSGAALTPDISVNQVPRPVIGLSREFMVIRSGNDQRITRSTVVVVNAIQLCGRVVQADKKTSLVLPITAKESQPLLGNVLLDDTGTNTTRCLLRPVGDGTLQGDVTRPVSNDPEIQAPTIRVGMEVRLLDDQWPRHAQMLLIGTIERISPSPDQPLRQRIVVRPSVDLRNVPEVFFRMPDLELNAEGGTP